MCKSSPCPPHPALSLLVPEMSPKAFPAVFPSCRAADRTNRAGSRLVCPCTTDTNISNAFLISFLRQTMLGCQGVTPRQQQRWGVGVGQAVWVGKGRTQPGSTLSPPNLPMWSHHEKGAHVCAHSSLDPQPEPHSLTPTPGPGCRCCDSFGSLR